MIPLTLVTGFLGSGKTTLLQHMAQQVNGKRLVFVVNEFAPLDVDGKLLGKDVDVVPIPGGSIFCQCLTTTFIEHLNALIKRHETESLDGIVIEASGMANPKVIRRMLVETGLDQHFAITQMIAVAEPVSLIKLFETLPNIREQLAAADIILLNKIDLADSATINKARSLICAINPRACLHLTINSEITLDLFTPDSALPVAGEYAKCKDPHFTQMTVRISDKPSRVLLRRALEKLGEDLYRAKGWVSCAEGPTFVDVASSVVKIQPVDRMPDDQSAIVLIGSGQAQKTLQTIAGSLAC